MLIDLKVGLTIVGGLILIVAAGFGWIIKLLQKQYKGAIIANNADGKIRLDIAGLDKKIAEHDKDIKHLQEQGKGFERKIDDLTTNIAVLSASVNETGIGLKLLKEEVSKMGQKFGDMDKKIDVILISLGDR